MKGFDCWCRRGSSWGRSWSYQSVEGGAGVGFSQGPAGEFQVDLEDAEVLVTLVTTRNIAVGMENDVVVVAMLETTRNIAGGI